MNAEEGPLATCADLGQGELVHGQRHGQYSPRGGSSHKVKSLMDPFAGELFKPLEDFNGGQRLGASAVHCQDTDSTITTPLTIVHAAEHS